MEEKKIKVRILPLHNIGGVGSAGDEVWMSEADAEMYVREGYVEVIEPTPSALSGTSPKSGSASDLGEEELTIMKPQAKRVRKK